MMALRAHLVFCLLATSVGCGDAPATTRPDTDTDTPDTADTLDTADTFDADTTSDVDWPEQQPADRDEDKAAGTGALLAGVAALPLDPPVGVSMGGFGNRMGPLRSPWADMFSASQGSHGHLWLKAIAFEVGGERLVLLKLPLPFSEDALTHAMLDTLEARFGLDLRGRVITAATHTHHGPARFWRLPSPLGIAGIDNADDEIIARFGERMAEVVATAIERLAPAEWGHAFVDDWDPQDRVHRDRRGSNDPRWGKDPRLTVLGVRSADGAPLALLANFGMHGTILGSENTLLSDDAGGGFEEELERRFFERFGTLAMGVFTQAGGGDSAPAGDHLGQRGAQRLQMVGVEGADKVIDAFERIEWTGNTELAVRSRMVGITHDWLYGDSGEFDGVDGKPIDGSLQCKIDPGTGVSQRGQPKDCISLPGVFGLIGATLPHPELNQTYLTVARLGDLFFLTLPGEPTYSITDYARQAVEALGAEVMVVGYSQDHLLYFTHPDDWYTGEYEAEFSLWGPWAGKWLVDRQVATVSAMLAGKNGPTYYEDVPDFSPPLGSERRALEQSVTAGEVHRQPADAARLDVVEVEVGGGDPALGLPTFSLERLEGEVFAPVLSAGRALDSGRLDGVTLYRPSPENGAELLEVRDHRWVWRWQVPPTWPAGRYRVVVSGRAKHDAVDTWTATSAVFSVTQSPDATLQVTANGERFALRLTHPPAPLATANDAYPLSGWRVFDTKVGPDARIEVRAPLTVIVTRGAEQLERTLSWDDGYHLDLTGSSLASGDGVTISVHLADDLEPAPITVPRP